MKILRKLWIKEVEDPEVWTTNKFVADLKERLVATCKMAIENLKISSGRYRNYNEKGPWQRQIFFSFFYQPPAISFVCTEKVRSQLQKK